MKQELSEIKRIIRKVESKLSTNERLENGVRRSLLTILITKF